MRTLASLLGFAVTGRTYFATMSRTYGFIDQGSSRRGATTLGIAHATGYPTLVVLRHLAVRLFPGSPVLVLNALSVLLDRHWGRARAGVIRITLREALGRRHAQTPSGFRVALAFLSAASFHVACRALREASLCSRFLIGLPQDLIFIVPELR